MRNLVLVDDVFAKLLKFPTFWLHSRGVFSCISTCPLLLPCYPYEGQFHAMPIQVPQWSGEWQDDKNKHLATTQIKQWQSYWQNAFLSLPASEEPHMDDSSKENYKKEYTNYIIYRKRNKEKSISNIFNSTIFSIKSMIPISKIRFSKNYIYIMSSLIYSSHVLIN